MLNLLGLAQHKKEEKNIMTENDVQKFEKLKIQIEEIYKEISILSKKSPDSAINEFKLKLVNNLLTIANELLVGSYKPFDDFDVFNDDELPSNSDVVMIISQYIECLEKLKYENVTMLSGDWFWLVGGKASKIRTTHPPVTFKM